VLFYSKLLKSKRLRNRFLSVWRESAVGFEDVFHIFFYRLKTAIL